MSKAIAFLAGMGTGYLKQKDKTVEDERQAARDKQQQQIFDANMADRASAAADKAALRVAGSPAVVNEATPAGPVDAGSSIPAAAAPIAPVASINGRSFASRGVADTAAAEMNTPEGIRKRSMAALAAQGNVVGADQMRTSGITADAAQMALDKGKRDEAASVFDLGVKEALQRGGPDALATFMSESFGDGAAGASKFQSVTLPSGQWQMNKVGEGGALTPIGQPFNSDESGYANAGFMLARGVKDKDKVAHLEQVKSNAQTKANQDAQTKIAQQTADSMEAARKATAAHQRRQDDREDRKLDKELSAIDIPAGMKWDKASDAFLRKLYTVKDADGNDSVDGGGMMFAKELAVMQARRNGGDETSAMGVAFQADNKIKAEAEGDPEKIRLARIDMLSRMRQAAPPAAGAVAQPPVAKPQGTGQNQANVPTIASTQTPAARATAGVQPSSPAAPQASPQAAQHIEAMAPLVEEFKTMQQALVRVAPVNNKASIMAYGAQAQKAREALLTEAIRRLGPDAGKEFVLSLNR
jgi:hypothetical protein